MSLSTWVSEKVEDTKTLCSKVGQEIDSVRPPLRTSSTLSRTGLDDGCGSEEMTCWIGAYSMVLLSGRASSSSKLLNSKDPLA